MQSRDEQYRYAYSSRLQPRTATVNQDRPTPLMPRIKDMNGEPIRRGDQVFTPVRDGRHEGLVEMIVTADEDATLEDIPNLPKVGYSRPRQGNDL